MSCVQEHFVGGPSWIWQSTKDVVEASERERKQLIFDVLKEEEELIKIKTCKVEPPGRMRMTRRQ